MRSRGVVFAFGAAALVVFALELASLALHRLAFGEPFSYRAAQAWRQRLAERRPNEETRAPGEPGASRELAEEEANNAQALHPYLGYVLDPERTLAWPVNDYGFLGEPPPLGADDPEAVSIALLGGSVAENTGLFAGDVLRGELEEIPAFRGRRVRLSLLALRGMKQPQQLAAVDWLLSLGARFDVVINLDGFNEVVLSGENALQGTNPFYPRRWRVRVEGIGGGEELAELGRIRFLEDLRGRLARRFSESILRFSITANLVQRGVDERIAAEVADARTRLNRSLLENPRSAAYQARGPLRAHESPEARHRDLADYWSRTSSLLDGRAHSAGFRYFHFLQPNQWVEDSKVFGDDERALARPADYFHRDAAVRGYPELIAAGRALQASGVAFTDLTMLFRDVSEPRYTDACCHLNLEGYREVARAMGREIREAYLRDAGR
jgi:hypothetical protein